MNCLKWKLSIAMSECKEEKSNNEKWDVFISWMRWKERKKSSYFDFLQIIHKENSLSIFDNERQRANIFGEKRPGKLSKRIIFLRSTTVWRAASIEFRIEWQKIYRSLAEKQKKKTLFTSETENYFPCRSLLYAIHSFSSHSRSQYNRRFIIRRRLGRRRNSMCS